MGRIFFIVSNWPTDQIGQLLSGYVKVELTWMDLNKEWLMWMLNDVNEGECSWIAYEYVDDLYLSNVKSG